MQNRCPCYKVPRCFYKKANMIEPFGHSRNQNLKKKTEFISLLYSFMCPWPKAENKKQKADTEKKLKT